jgi:hypothetical protein
MVLPGLACDFNQALRSILSLQNPLVTGFSGDLKGKNAARIGFYSWIISLNPDKYLLPSSQPPCKA